jgi:hypothetical protein
MNKGQQRIAAFGFGIAFVGVMLAIAFVISNPTPFQYLVFRIVLALAAAGIAAMIPGFLHVSFPPVIQAGGGLAVFAIVFFYNPAALVPTTSHGTNKPLEGPIRDVTPKAEPPEDEDSKSSQRNEWGPHESSSQDGRRTSLAKELLESAAEAQSKSIAASLRVVQVLEGKNSVFDVTVRNTMDASALLTRIDVEIHYYSSPLVSAAAYALVPLAGYVVDCPVHTNSHESQRFSQLLSPSISLPPGTAKDPTLATFRVQLNCYPDKDSDGFGGDDSMTVDAFVVAQSGQRLQLLKGLRWL